MSRGEFRLTLGLTPRVRRSETLEPFGEHPTPVGRMSSSRNGASLRTIVRCLSAIACTTAFLILPGGSLAQVLRIYSNQTVGFTLSHPDNWFVVTSAYKNASELRNHDDFHPVPEKDEARILVSWEQPLSLEQAHRRVKGLVDSASKRPGFQVEKVPAGESVLYQWTVLEPPAVPAIGKSGAAMRMRVRVSSALVGIPLVRADGTIWEDASPEVVAEMKKITQSIRLLPEEGGGR